jgi:hypothetical protein
MNQPVRQQLAHSPMDARLLEIRALQHIPATRALKYPVWKLQFSAGPACLLSTQSRQSAQMSVFDAPEGILEMAGAGVPDFDGLLG